MLRRLGVPGAWCIALLFAIHPGQMAGPAIILHRKDVLSATFVLLSIRLWLPGGEHARPCPGVVWSLRATRHVCVAALWFFVALFPYLGFMDHHSLGMSLAWPRHRYLASVAPIALVVGLAFYWVPRLWTFRLRFSAPVVAAPFVALCLVVDFGQSTAFVRPSAWTGYQLRYNPDRLRTHLWHVWELALEGDSQGALEAARAGVLRFADSALAHAGLAEVYAKRFERAHARAHYGDGRFGAEDGGMKDAEGRSGREESPARPLRAGWRSSPSPRETGRGWCSETRCLEPRRSLQLSQILETGFQPRGRGCDRSEATGSLAPERGAVHASSV